LDFKVQYSSIVRVYLLPKPHSNQSHAVIALDPPIRKGQTFYPHILAMFNDDEHLTVEPKLEAEMKEKFPTLESVYDGPAGEVFVRVLKNMAGVKLTRQSLFQASAGGHAIRVSHKADVGLLYPLEKAFFYLPKPPLLLHYSEVDEVEFERHAAGGHSSGRTFDVSINMKSGSSYDFHGIQRSEFQNLVNFLTAKQVRISNVDANARADEIIAEASDDDDDGYVARDDEDSEEDEDFAAGSESDGGEPTDSDSESESDEPSKKSRKSPKGKKSKRAKKDPNAPKRALSAYMFFSAAKRAEVAAANPDFGITDVAKALGERWKTITDEEKNVYQQQADEDKIRYEREMTAYRAGAAVAPAGEADADADAPVAMDED
jgi:structure-specific recognition protein 1